MFEATLNEDFWGDEDFTCSECHITFTSRKGASEHAETKHQVKRLLIKDRAQVKVKTEPGDGCQAIEDIVEKMKDIKVEGGKENLTVSQSTEEFIEEDENEADSDTGSEPERYDREAQSHALFQEKLGSDQEDDDDEEEEKEASFYPSLYFSVFCLSGGGNSRHVHQQ